jgi:1,4-alpha-glucan branching enzyme
MVSTLHPDALNALLYADNGAPHTLLGAHPESDGRVSVRIFRPDAHMLAIVDEATGTHYPMTRYREEGFFEVTFPADAAALRYHVHARAYNGHEWTFYDPYATAQFPFLLSDMDLYLYGEGKLIYAYERFGAHLRTIDGVRGVNFAVWAPNARRMSVVGEFNHWDARVHPMIPRSGGVWELFIPGIGEGELYRYDVRSHHRGYAARKSDPFGFYTEMRPSNASITADIFSYTWNDGAWMQARERSAPLDGPMSIYEVHLGSWRRGLGNEWLSYEDSARQLAAYAVEMGYTHIELLPIAEHPFDGSWGYQVTGYYAPTSRFGTPTEFMRFVDILHQHGIGVILDWVPAHFPKDGHALSFFDGTHLYEHDDPRRGEHPDWGTYIFNYGRNEVRNFLTSNALFWLKHYHIDGLRVDAVTSMLFLNFSRGEGQWLPNQYGGDINLEALAFLREMNEIVHMHAPGTFTVAEESSSYPLISRPTYLGGVGFTFKWNMGWMHDTLDYMELDPVYRRSQHNTMTFSLMYAFKENYVLALSHDEVVHLKKSLLGKMAGDWWQKFASLRLMFGYMFGHPGKKLHFMGSEWGVWDEWAETRSLDWRLLDWPSHAGMQRWMRALNHMYRDRAALYSNDYDWSGFEWIQVDDAENSVFAFARLSKDGAHKVIVVANFTPVVRHHYAIGVFDPGRYVELLNSDDVAYGGSGVRALDGVQEAAPEPLGKFAHRLTLTLPPLACVFLALEGDAGHSADAHAHERAADPLRLTDDDGDEGAVLEQADSRAADADAPREAEGGTVMDDARFEADSLPEPADPPGSEAPAQAEDTPHAAPEAAAPVSETPMDTLAAVVASTADADTGGDVVPRAITAAEPVSPSDAGTSSTDAGTSSTDAGTSSTDDAPVRA